MRIRLKAPQGLTTTGIFGADGKEAEVGTEVVVSEEPTGWAGRYDIIDAEEKAGKEPVTGEDELDRDELKKQADELGLEYPSNVKTAKLKELIDAKLAE